ncbi:putative glutamate receptor [Folsomia candida]|uniref:Putative glutamate receptor n=1 Tax=Folsomia candida TaxID=158441 RepID=A0A226DUA7_FOLCA|nr:putative glutamate receptor [Folsomia candida]
MSKLHRVVLLLNILSTIIDTCAGTGSNYDVGVPRNFLQGVENCDIQILKDVIPSNYVAFLSDSLLPTTVVFTTTHYTFTRFENFVLNVLKSRPAPFKISIWISNLFLHSEEKSRDDGSMSFSGWLKICTSYHYGFRCNKCEDDAGIQYHWIFLRSSRNVYPIVPTSMGLGEVLATLGIDDNLPENFFLALLPKRKSGAFTRICIKRDGLGIRWINSYKCVDKDEDNILKDFTKLVFLPQTWVGEYFSPNIPIGSNQNLPHRSTNPFSRDVSISIPLYMAVIVVTTGTNSSLDMENVYRRYPKIGIEVGEVNIIQHGQLSEFTLTSGFQFLSCYAESYLSFNFYLTPFQPILWLGLITSFGLTLIVISFYMFWKHQSSPFPVWMSFFSLLFINSFPVPQFVKNGSFYRLIFLAWGLVAFLLAACYSGLITSELNAPFKQTRPQTFEDLICQHRHILNNLTEINSSRLARSLKFDKYSAYWGTFDPSLIFPTHRNQFALDHCFSLLSTSYQQYWAGYEPQFSKNLIQRDDLISLFLMSPVHDVIPTGYVINNASYSTTELQVLVEKNIINCEKKSVFIAMSEGIWGEMNFLSKNYPSKKFYTGKSIILTHWFGWTFRGGGRNMVTSGVSQVQRNFQSLVSSGIYSRLKTEMATTMWLRRWPAKNDTSLIPSSMNLNGAVVTLFILCGALAGLSLICLLIESRNRVFICIKPCFGFVAQKIIKLCCHICYNDFYSTSPKAIQIEVSSSHVFLKKPL